MLDGTRGLTRYRSALLGRSILQYVWMSEKQPVAHPRWGVEFDWYGFDPAGNVAVFSSAGYGPVPLDVVDHAEALDGWYERRVLLPTLGACAASPQEGGDFSDWIGLAERGFYGFDWKVWEGPYRRLTVPARPATLADLPSDLRHLASLVGLDVDFSAATQVDLAQLGIRTTS